MWAHTNDRPCPRPPRSLVAAPVTTDPAHSSAVWFSCFFSFWKRFVSGAHAGAKSSREFPAGSSPVDYRTFRWPRTILTTRAERYARRVRDRWPVRDLMAHGRNLNLARANFRIVFRTVFAESFRGSRRTLSAAGAKPSASFPTVRDKVRGRNELKLRSRVGFGPPTFSAGFSVDSTVQLVRSKSSRCETNNRTQFFFFQFFSTRFVTVRNTLVLCVMLLTLLLSVVKISTQFRRSAVVFTSQRLFFEAHVMLS